MNVGDRVKHRKYGLGEIKTLYPKYDAARVLYDSGKESTNACKRLSVVPADWGRTKESTPDAPAVLVPETPTKARRGGGAGTARVDYDLLDRAKAHFEREFPDAHQVVPRWHGDRAYCEVYDAAGSAKVYFYVEKTKKR